MQLMPMMLLCDLIAGVRLRSKAAGHPRFRNKTGGVVDPTSQGMLAVNRNCYLSKLGRL